MELELLKHGANQRQPPSYEEMLNFFIMKVFDSIITICYLGINRSNFQGSYF